MGGGTADTRRADEIGRTAPEWRPEGAGTEFACSVMSGVKARAVPREYTGAPAARPATAEDYARGITAGDRVTLARAITVIESNAPKHFELGQEIIRLVLPRTGRAMRVGITGIPGAGKSTFIEALGTRLCGEGHKVAVLAVDPSSSLTKGSILGDKTRMEKLAREKNAFIRPSPSGGSLGGVTRKSRETMLLCEAAGYDTILVETVGVGQSETAVRSMVDFFLVVVITGAGDELQGIKKGIIELADAILVNKADGGNKLRTDPALSAPGHGRLEDRRLHVLVADGRGNSRNMERRRKIQGDDGVLGIFPKAPRRTDNRVGTRDGGGIHKKPRRWKRGARRAPRGNRKAGDCRSRNSDRGGESRDRRDGGAVVQISAAPRRT